MSIIRHQGPMIITGGPYNPTLTGALEYNDSAGPSIFAHSVGLTDNRFASNAGGDISNVIPCWFGADFINVLNQAPSTLSTTNIVAAAVPVAGTAMTLAGASTGITVVGAGGLSIISGQVFPANALMIDGNPALIQLTPAGGGISMYDPRTMIGRCLRFTSAGDDHLATAAVVGVDVYGYLVHETVTLTNATVATSKKALKAVISITPAGTLSGSNLSVGTSDVYGFPMGVYEAAQNTVLPPFVQIFWNGTLISASTGYTAGVATTPSATTGDTRGTYATQSASDGTKKLQVFVRPSAWNLTATTLFGALQF